MNVEPAGKRAPRFWASAGFGLALASAIAFVICSLGVIWIVYSSVRSEALHEAEDKALILLNRNLAIHTYFNVILKPRIFDVAGPALTPDSFDPTWMSSTFVVREINGIADGLRKHEGYYYKECAINARSPLNEADAFERQFLLELNSNKELHLRTGVREIEGKPFFYMLRRGESMTAACLRCHSTSDQAPGGLVARYGPDRSFHRAVDEVVSALSIRVPLEQAYADANKLALELSLAVVISFAFLFFFLYALMQGFIFGPLSLMRQKAEDISRDDRNLGQELPMPHGTELQELSGAFNTMSGRLKDHLEHLEDRVQERTAELENALAQVKTLKGLLPICASCKKIRDDQGSWKQVEAYIKERSDAEFTHGICPDCMKRLYPEYWKNQETDSGSGAQSS